MFEKFRPLGDRVYMQRLEDQATTSGGIIIPDAAKERAQTCKVIAVGPGRYDATTNKHIPLSVKAGDIVYIGKYSGTETSKECVIVREDEILGIVEK